MIVSRVRVKMIQKILIGVPLRVVLVLIIPMERIMRLRALLAQMTVMCVSVLMQQTVAVA